MRMRASDTVVFLDYPRWLCVWQALRRHVEYRNKKRSDMPDGWRERLSPDFLWFVWTYRSEQRLEVFRLLALYGEGRSVVVLKNPLEAQAFLASVLIADQAHGDR